MEHQNDMPRVSIIDRLRPVAAILLPMLVLYVLFWAFTQHMYYYAVPAGTTVVDASVIETYSPLGKYIDGLKWTKTHKWIKPYLPYRHYIIPDGATEIAENAFRGHKDVVSVRIPDSVTKIASRAFQDCERLESVTLSDGLTEIPASVFSGCASLVSVRIPDSV